MVFHRLSQFEPIQGIPLVLVTWKVIFLVDITLSCIVSELAALFSKEWLLVLHRDMVVL